MPEIMQLLSRKSVHPLRSSILIAAAFSVVAGCGGGKKAAVDSNVANYAAKCESPRTGNDPTTGRPFPDLRGAVLDEKRWIQAWSNALYLWYSELPNIDPAADGYPRPVDYFSVLKTSALTPSGNPKDRFHFANATADWIATSQSGIEAGYGARWAIIRSRPPRQIFIAYTEPNSPAATAGLKRGDQVLTIDGVDVENGTDVNTLNRGLSPSGTEQSHTFAVRDRGTTTSRNVTLTPAVIEIASVQNVRTLTTPSGNVGYILFNTHIATAEAALVSAVERLRTMGISDLVLDLRYNGGGYLDIANELSYMIAGPTATNGKTFEKVVFNDKYPDSNPVTGRPVAATFRTTTQFSTPGRPLPTLGLNRLFVLTGGGTCSASESVINGLRGIDLTVIEIGATTCGKPYGFYPQDNCGTTYFSIQFKTANHKGFGDYPDGFSPGGTDPAGVPGCRVADDFLHDLGDASEGRLAAALAYRANQTCPASSPIEAEYGPGAADVQLMRSAWHENRIYLE